MATSRLEALETARDVARASLARAEEELALYQVRSPIDGEILDIHARGGERVGPEGIAEVGQTEAMYAPSPRSTRPTSPASGSVSPSRVRSPALAHDLEGFVERIGLKIGKNEILTTDPVADADARVVEVEIRLLEPELARHLTNLRVEVQLLPERESPAR